MQSPFPSTFSLVVVGFVILIIAFKLITAIKNEQKGSSRYRSLFLPPDSPSSLLDPYSDPTSPHYRHGQSHASPTSNDSGAPATNDHSHSHSHSHHHSTDHATTQP